MKSEIHLHYKDLAKITILPAILFLTLQADTDISTLPDCNGNTCTINNNINDKVTVYTNNKYYETIINNATIGTNKEEIGLDLKESNNNNKISIGILTNNGTIIGSLNITNFYTGIKQLNNYGIIYGITSIGSNGATIKELNNYGTIHLTNSNGNNNKSDKFFNLASMMDNITIKNYHIHINQDSNTFNSFSGYSEYSDDTSHLVINGENNSGDKNYDTYIKKDAKFILSVGSNFNLNTDYSLNKLITKLDGTKYNLQYEDLTLVSDLFSHLTTQSPTFYLEKNGNYFRISVDTASSIGNAIYKSNIQTMNSLISYINVFSTSNMTDKYTLALNDSNTSYLASDFRKYDRFYYKDEVDNIILARSGIRATARPNTMAQPIDKQKRYDFFFTPFVSQNILTKSNGFGLSGLNYGFVSGISFNIGSINTLGIHTGFSYGEIEGKKDISTTNINTISTALGAHYKLDLDYGIYIKAFLNMFYFLNNVSLNQDKQKPNALGYSSSAYIGKIFDFNEGGTLSIDIGGSYQGIQNNEINFQSETYSKNLLNLIYADLYTSYSKIFDSGFGLNVGFGTKILFTKPTARIIIGGYNDFEIGVDKILGIARFGINYNINNSINLNLDYIGNIGDRSMSNSGMFNIRVLW